jgi:predicted metal-dependent peptidase
MAARYLAADRWPYVAALVFALRPVEVGCEQLPTVAVDDRWRLYYCPAFVLACAPAELATVLLHECGHLMRQHSRRFQELRQPSDHHPIWNIAGDAVINEPLDEAGMPWPAVEPVRIEQLADFGVRSRMSTEAIYHRILAAVGGGTDAGEESPQGSVAQTPGNAPGDAPGDDGPSGPDEPAGTSPGGGPPGDASPGSDRLGAGTPGESAGGRTRGNAPSDGDRDDAAPSGSGAAGSGEPGRWNGGQDPPRSAGGLVRGSTTPPRDCGSAAHGTRQPYELPSDDDLAPAADISERESVLDEVAEGIERRSKMRGDVPGSLLRWARERRSPTVPWRRVLSSLIRASAATAAGRRDYTYRFPSRRSEALRGPLNGAVLPALRQPPPPRTAVVVDTSGSVGPEELQQMLGEVYGIVRAIGFDRGFTVIPCDARAHPPIPIRRRSQLDELRLLGGGGTDMRQGLKAAHELRPRPNLVVVLTDGFTPWPEQPLHPAVDVIVALTEEDASGRVPEWARTVVIGPNCDEA